MSKIKLQIKNRWSGSIIFEYEKENNTIAETVNEYVRIAHADLTHADLTDADLYNANLIGANLTRANLTDANLTDANLIGANLTDANLTRANLIGANLTDANLIGANLTDANLYNADLIGADLTHANLTDANLTDANLIGANLIGANLTSANLTRVKLNRADLTRADLTYIKNDFWEILLKTKNEVSGLKEALINGKVDGSTYSGECCCLVGTIAKVKGCSYENIKGIKPNTSRPAERWFFAIRKGDIPNTSEVVELTIAWIEEFELYLKA